MHNPIDDKYSIYCTSRVYIQCKRKKLKAFGKFIQSVNV
ncbi:hypothetical protein Tsp_04749 [Trichinella spiralis]|nr:hypothetical protein Tsp_04749 [Trichinella spiralis]